MVLANTGSFLSPFKQEYIYTYYNLFILGNDHVLQELANIKFTEATSRQLLRWIKMYLRSGLLINYHLHDTTVHHYKSVHIASTSFF